MVRKALAGLGLALLMMVCTGEGRSSPVQPEQARPLLAKVQAVPTPRLTVAATLPPASPMEVEPPTPAPASPQIARPADLGYPVSVTVDGITAPVDPRPQHYITTPGPNQGLVSAPDNDQVVGWYRYRETNNSPYRGATTLISHVGYSSAPGAVQQVFLAVKPGDRLTVKYQSGQTVTYVPQVGTDSKGQPTVVQPSPKGGVDLRVTQEYNDDILLVTCDPTSQWNDQTGHYAGNSWALFKPMS